MQNTTIAYRSEPIRRAQDTILLIRNNHKWKAALGRTYTKHKICKTKFRGSYALNIPVNMFCHRNTAHIFFTHCTALMLWNNSLEGKVHKKSHTHHNVISIQRTNKYIIQILTTFETNRHNYTYSNFLNMRKGYTICNTSIWHIQIIMQ